MVQLEKLSNKIKNIFLQEPEAIAVYLFGSIAAGKAGPNSDVDLAVLFDPELSKERKFDLRLHYIFKLEDGIGMPVDVVDLSTVSLVFQHRVLRTGVLVYEKDKKKRIMYEVCLRREYFDFRYYLDRYEKAVLHRI